jgi:hypothetical protein
MAQFQNGAMTNRREFIAAIGAGTLGVPATCLEPTRIVMGGGNIDVAIAPGDVDAGRDAIIKWISDAAHAVTVYFGRFPVPLAAIEVRPVAERSGIFGGVTYSETPARTRIAIGQHTTRRNSQPTGPWPMN